MNDQLGFGAKIVADSVFNNGARVTTVELTFPRCILAEFNTHRMFSRNAASSRAIPADKMISAIVSKPFIPDFKKNARGMQGTEALTPEDLVKAESLWVEISQLMVEYSKTLSDPKGLNIHKQFTNRLLEPFMWVKVVATATDWSNMFAQRTHPSAEPSFQKAANLLYEEYSKSVPIERPYSGDRPDTFSFTGGWHLPYVNFDSETERFQLNTIKYDDVLAHIIDKLGYDGAEHYPVARFKWDLLKDVSVGRLAKLSYNNLETGKIDVLNDIRLAVQLSMSNPGHWSPFEHVCRKAEPHEMRYDISQLTIEPSGASVPNSFRIVPREGELGYCGNLLGVAQYRKSFDNENILEFNR